MKAKTRIWVIGLLAVFALPLTAQTVYFQDGFENGLNTQWTQSFYDPSAENGQGAWVSTPPKNSQSWKTEKGVGLDYPDGTVVGKGRAYFRLEAPAGQHVQSSGYRTRLITPKMDLRIGYQPILRFYHAQAKWTADFDTLRVFYRKGDQGAWYVLREYTEPIASWTFEEVTLPLVGKDYQIAFEASENMGRGIVLDSVIVRTKPQVTTPHDIDYYDMRDNGLNLTWEASKDADYFRVVVSTKDLNLNICPDSIESETVVADEFVVSSIQDLRIGGLTGGQAYYVQIQSIGAMENSIWSDSYRFRMKPVVNIPYTEDFKLVYKSDKLSDQQLITWCWGGDYQPFIPLSIGSDKYGYFSVDKSEAVVFPGTKNNTSSEVYQKTIPAGLTSWLVSPEISGRDIANFSLSKCHVTFWGTTYTFQQDRARSIIVGAMTDPEDITTFVPVDTCEVWGYQAFTYFDVDLSSYKGSGRYVAFVSNFAGQDNWYALDKVTIAQRQLPKPVVASEIHVVPTTTTATVTWPKSEGAASYKVKFQMLSNKGTSTPLYADKVGGTTKTVTTNSIDLTGLTVRNKYALTIQAVAADGTTTSEWSQPMAFYTSAKVDLPKTYGFETTDNGGTITINSLAYLKDWCFFSNDAVTPYCYNYSSYARNGKNSLYGVVESSSDVWVVMPYVAEVTLTEINFYLRTTTQAYAGSSVDVGVMSEPTNLQTFVKMGEFVASGMTYQKCYINFVNYSGDGKYIAIRWGKNGDSKNAICIDDVTIQDLASCFAPSVEMSNITDKSAVISWKKQEASYSFDVKVNSKSIAEAALEITDGDVCNLMGTTQSSVALSELSYAHTYYVYIRTHCSASEYSDWSCVQFMTDCPSMMSLPYECKFDNDVAAMGVKPSCWIPAYMTSSTTNPYLSKSYASSAPNSLYMPSSLTTASFIAMPMIDAELNNIIVRYKAYSSTANYQMIVGVMSDPTDYKTFEVVDTFTVPVSGKWSEHKTMLIGQKGRGKHIAFTTYNGKTNTLYLDDVQVTDITDAPPFNYTRRGAGEDWIEAEWEGITSQQWQVVVTSKFYPLGDDDSFDPSVIAPGDKKGETKTSDFSYKVSGLSPQTWYYFYARSTASEEWSMDSLQTECTTWNPTVAVSEGFEIGKTATTSLTGTNDTLYNYFRFAKIPQCWTVGNRRGVYVGQATTYSMRNYWPYICSNGNITTSGAQNNYYDRGTALTTQCYSYSGYNSLKLYGYYSSADASNYAPAYAAMNQLDCSDKDLQQLTISGYYQMANTSGCALIVGVMDDPTDLRTFVVLDSIKTGNGTGVDKCLYFEVSMEDYKGKGRYIAFRTPYNKSTTIYLDDICVTSAGCPAPKPSVSQITDVSAVIASGLKVDKGWTYIITSEPYSTQLLDKGQRPDPSIVVKQGTLSQTTKRTRVSGLTADTKYYVYMASVCDGQQNSAWRQTKFTTLCPPVDITTWFEGFEQYATGSNQSLGCWTVGSRTTSATAAYIPYVSNSNRKELGKVLGLYCTSTYSGAYAISPGLKVPNGKSLNDYMIRFYGYGTSSVNGSTTSSTYEHNLRVGVVTDPSDLTTMTILDTIPLETKTRVQHVMLDKLKLESDKTYYLLFLLERDYNTYARAMVDSICLKEIPACRFPTSITIDNITYSKATVTWSGTSASYQVAFSTRDLNDAEKDSILNDPAKCAKYGIRLQTAAKNTVQVTGLTANTRYYVYVQGVCGSTRSDWSYESAYFKTDCAPYVSVPFTDNFDNCLYYGAGYQPDCYYGYQDKGSSTSTSASYGPKYYPYVHNTTGYNSKHSIYFYAINNTTAATHCILAIPTLDPQIDPATLQINFWARRGSKTASYNSRLVLGMVKTQTEVETFVPLDTLNLTDLDVNWHYQEFNLNLGKYQNVLKKGYENFAFYMPTPARPTTTATYNQMYLDNLKITYIPTCYVPKNVKITQIGFSTLSVSFDPAVASDNEWDVLVTEKKTGKQLHYTALTTDYTLTGLKHSTDYTVQVRTVCGDNDYSDYTDAVSCNTKWEIDTYTWTFNQNEQGTVSVMTSITGTENKHILHPGLTDDARDTTWHYGSPHMYLPYQEFNTTSMSYSTDPHGVQEGDTSRALKFNTTVVHDSVTVILPYVRNAKLKQLSMDVRSGDQYTDNHSNVMLQNVVSNSYPKATISIGVVDSMCGMETFRELTAWRPSQLFKTDTLHAASRYGWDHVVLPLTDYDLRGKQLALMMHGCGSATMYVDNLSVEAKTGLQTPYITSLDVADTYVTLHWTGNANKYNVYVIDTTRAVGKYPRFIPYLEDADSRCVVKKTNVSGKSYKIEGLTENSTYAFYVEDASGIKALGTLSNRKIVTTVCAAIDASAGYEYDFEPGPYYKNNGTPATSIADGFTWLLPASTTQQDTIYKIPECWQIGLTTDLYDPLSQSTYKTYLPSMTRVWGTSTSASVGWDESYALGFYGTNATYNESYAVMPLFSNLNKANSEVYFYGRCGYVSSSTQMFSPSMTTSTKLVIGTMSDPNDPVTFVPIDTVNWDYTKDDISSYSIEVASDPTGMQYFQTFAVPLDKMRGEYIAFRQVGYGTFYVDNLKIQTRQTCRHPRDLQVLKLEFNQVTLGWRGMEQGGTYVVEISESYTDWSHAKSTTLSENKATFTGLKESQTYFYRVKQLHPTLGESRFAHAEQFTTTCANKDPNAYKTSFEGTDTDESMVIPTMTSLKQNRCWQYIQRGSSVTTSTYFPQNIGSTSAQSYAHSGSVALKLYSAISSQKLTSDAYAILPKMSAEVGQKNMGFDTLQLVFWACPSPHTVKSGKIAAASAATDAKCVEIGTCTDPDDLSTYTILEKWYYKADNNILAKDAPANSGNNYAFQKAVIKLNKATGPYVYLRATVDRGDNVAYSASTLYIDDLSFERLTNCDEPTELGVDAMTCSQATINWKSDANNFDVVVSKDPTFTDEEMLVISKTNVKGNQMVVTGLSQQTNYYFRVKAYCDAERKNLSEWSQNGYFRTPYAPLYQQQFTSAEFANEDGWTAYTGYADKVFAGLTTPTLNTSTGSYNSWQQVQNIAFSGYAMRLQLYYTTNSENYWQKYWLVSPGVALEGNNAQLVFDLAKTYYKASSSSTATSKDVRTYDGWDEGWDDQFMVIISDDNGKTWKKENATIWNDETSTDPQSEHYRYGRGTYSLRALTTTPVRYAIDLSKYKGKTIRVAFYGENTEQNCQSAVHVDNFHINYLSRFEQSIERCQFEDIVDVLGFNVSGDSVSPGDTTISRSSLSIVNGVNDSLVILHVHYKEAPIAYERVTVCEGTPFKYKDFNEHSAPGTYRMKLTSQVTGCDSIVNLTIQHTPYFLTQVDTTLYYGVAYRQGDKVYTKAGYYEDTLTTSEKYGGCDSIIQLSLSYTSQARSEQYQQVCQGESWYWKDGDTILSTTGVYMHCISRMSECDSMVVMHFTAIAPVRTIREDSIKEGESYAFAQKWLTKADIYIDTVKAESTGCDSILELHLKVIPAPVIYKRDTICEGDSYSFGKQLLKAPGTYRDSTYDAKTHAMAITQLTLSMMPKTSSSLGTKYIKPGDSYLFFDRQLTETGTYYQTLMSSYGCDSTVSVTVVVQEVGTGVEEVSICPKELPYRWKDSIVCDKAGIYPCVIKREGEVDSTVNLVLTVIEPVSKFVEDEFCLGSAYPFGTKILTMGGTYYDTLQSALTGCDSIIVLTLVQKALEVRPRTAYVCEGDSMYWNGMYISKAALYRDTVSEVGSECLFIEELTLKNNYPVKAEVRRTICEGDSLIFNGEVLKQTCNRQMISKSLVTGCDSTTQLQLTVNPSTYHSIPVRICKGETYYFGKKPLTQSGEYYDTLVSASGCDSIVTLILTVNEPLNTTITDTICSGQTYTFAGKQLSQSGTYYDTIVDRNGCQAIRTLHLTARAPGQGSQTATFCKVYTYEGKVFTVAGVYTVAFKDELGCDTVVTLTLIQTLDAHDTTRAMICQGQRYEDEDFIVWSQGKYEAKVFEEEGCILTRILYLDVISDFLKVDTIVYQGSLPYKYHSLEYPVGTPVGVYTDTVEVDYSSCHQTVYHTLRIVEGTDLDEIVTPREMAHKVLYHEQLYIIKDDKWYDLTGTEVKSPIQSSFDDKK